MAKTTERAFALTLAILFLVTSVGFSAFVIWQMYDQSKKPKQNDIAEQIKQQTQGSNAEQQKMADFEPLGEAKVNELKVTDVVNGDGAEIKADSKVTIKYTGALAKDGVIFDSTELKGGEPIEMDLGGVIPGFREGLLGMKVGGKRRILIPSNLGYGENGSGSIPPNSDLVFDITLVNVK